MVDATSKECPRAGDPFECTEKRHGEVFDRIGASIREFFFREFPHSFVGIQFGSIRRESFEAQARIPATYRVNRIAFVDGGIIPNHHHRTA